MRKWLILSAVITSFAASAGTYRWVDEQGNVHYGDQPPPGAQRIKAPPPPAEPGQSFASETPSDPTPKPESRSGPMSAADACQEYKSRLNQYKANAHMAVRGDDGEPRMLSSEERQNLINQTQKRADQACAQASAEGS